MTAFVVEVVFVRNSHTSEARSSSVNVSDHMAISGARVTHCRLNSRVCSPISMPARTVGMSAFEGKTRTTIVAHVAAVKAAGTGIALCRAQVTVFQRRNAAQERRQQGEPSF
jgi:hypothetical protein